MRIWQSGFLGCWDFCRKAEEGFPRNADFKASLGEKLQEDGGTVGVRAGFWRFSWRKASKGIAVGAGGVNGDF